MPQVYNNKKKIFFSFLTQECQLLERLTELENHHFITPNIVTSLGKDY